MPPPLRVSVLGAGAIGSMFGGLLKVHAPNCDVALLARGEHAQAIRAAGHVRLEGPWGTHQAVVRLLDDVSGLAGSDVVLVTVKSQATASAMADAAPYLGDALVVSIQNGINQHVLGRHVRADRLVVAMTATNMAVLVPGAVSLQLNGATILGPAAPEARAAVPQTVDLLRRTSLPVQAHENVVGAQYNKLTINALGYAACLSASNFITEAVCDRGWRQAVGLPLLDECIAAYDAAGIALARIPGVPDARRFRRVLRLLDVPLLGAAIAAAARARFNRRPIVFSLYQDLLRGKPTEIDYINGEIVRLAEAHGLRAPRSALAVALAHELERRGAGSFFARDELLARFRAAG